MLDPKIGPELRLQFNLYQDWLWAEDMLYTYFRGILIKRKQEYGEEEIIKQKAKLR